MLQHNKIAHIYNPSNQSFEEVLENFVIRKSEFNKILRDLKNTDFKSLAQHFLIEGQRGTGKTSLLLRTRYEIENNKELSKSLIAVQFAEEQYNIFDLSRLWESAAEKLEETEGFETLSDELDDRSEDENYIEECFGILEKYLLKNKKRLVLLLDNFGDILDKLSDIEQKRLRDIFHTSNHIQLIATSSRALEHTYKHDKPFFEFFKIVKLDGLDKKDTILLLEQLAKTTNKDISNILDKESSRIETIRRLTGGIPRTIVLLFEIFQDESANVFEDLEMILDRVTPLYKHRMDDLSTQQQAIMDTIALNWDGITASEIVSGLKKRGFDTKKVSTHLLNLEKNDLVLSRYINKTNKLYLIKERFFNIWYLMRYGRKKNKLQVRWLVRFLEEWCNNDELINRAKSHIKCAKDGNLNLKGGQYMAEALASIIKDRDLQHDILNETRKALVKNNPNIKDELSKSDKELLLQGLNYFIEEKYTLCIKFLNQVLEKNKSIYLVLGSSYALLEKNDNAIENLKKSLNKDNLDSYLILALIYEEKKLDIKNAIKYYKLASKLNNSEAMYKLANIYLLKYQDVDNSIKYYNMAVENNHSSSIEMLSYIYYILAIEKTKSLELIQKSISIETNQKKEIILASILLWNNTFEESIINIKKILHLDYSEDLSSLTDYFLLLLAKKQYNLSYNIFEEFPDLKIKFKPIYYALMTIQKEKYPKEYLKMGEELEDTVNEILVKVEEKAKKYK